MTRHDRGRVHPLLQLTGLVLVVAVFATLFGWAMYAPDEHSAFWRCLAAGYWLSFCLWGADHVLSWGLLTERRDRKP